MSKSNWLESNQWPHWLGLIVIQIEQPLVHMSSFEIVPTSDITGSEVVPDFATAPAFETVPTSDVTGSEVFPNLATARQVLDLVPTSDITGSEVRDLVPTRDGNVSDLVDFVPTRDGNVFDLVGTPKLNDVKHCVEHQLKP